jgi:hypothetical protein
MAMDKPSIGQVPHVPKLDITIPPALVELFGKKPRVVVVPGGGGIGVPVDFKVIKAEALQHVMTNPEVASKFELMIVARQ